MRSLTRRLVLAVAVLTLVVVKRRLQVCRMLLAWTVFELGLDIVVSPTPARANTITVLPSSEGATSRMAGGQTTFAPLSFVGGTFDLFDTGALVFDLSSIPRGTTITSATFTMSVGGTLQGTAAPGMSVSEYVAPGPLLSLSNFPLDGSLIGTFGGLPLSAAQGTINVVQTFDVTSFILSLVNNGTPYPGYLFGATIFSVVDIPGSTVPSLTITSPAFLAVPEPPSALLLALGIAAVLLVAVATRPMGITRQRKAKLAA